jgi:cytochrome c1
LSDLVRSYDERFSLGLSDQETQDLVEYLKSL